MTDPAQDPGAGSGPAEVVRDARSEADRLLEERASLAAKIAWIAGQVARLPKTRKAPTGSGGTFAYTPVEDMAAAVTGLCAAVGVSLLPSVVDPLSEGADWRDPDPGRQRTRWRYLYRVTWTVTDGREEYRVQTMGEAMDYGDKGSNKALTAARKYLYMMLFHLQTGDDPDASHAGEEGDPGPAPRQTAARGRGRPAERSGGRAEGSGTPPPPEAPADPLAGLSPEDARKARRRWAAVLAAAEKMGADEAAAREAVRAAGARSRAGLLDVTVWLKVCEDVGITPADPLPPDPLGAEAVQAQAARDAGASS